jgi:hypothetical protein
MEVSQGNSLWSYLEQVKMLYSSFFFNTKLENRRAEQVLPEGTGTSGKGEEVGKWWRRVNMAQSLCTHVCKWKKGTVENILGMGVGEWRKMVKGTNSSMIYLIHCKNLGKCHNVPPQSITKKKSSKRHTVHVHQQFLNTCLSLFYDASCPLHDL